MDLEARLLRLEATLVRLAEAQAQTEAALVRLAEAQARTEGRGERLEARMEQVEAALVRLAEAQAHTEERLARLATQVQALAEAQARTEEQLAQQVTQLQTLVGWQRGEAGRREGERYERDVVRRASVFFNGGDGGAPDQPEVQRRLAKRLRSVLAEGILPSEADPFLADLLWWKGDQLVVAEVSLQINGEDVNRVTQRAGTLRRGGIQAMAVVIGEDWATLDTQERARALQIAWKVGNDLSPGFLAFRRLAPEDGGGVG
jgi:multidrug efflux pump subunit AcrA (membrane-fusion protein)